MFYGSDSENENRENSYKNVSGEPLKTSVFDVSVRIRRFLWEEWQWRTTELVEYDWRTAAKIVVQNLTIRGYQVDASSVVVSNRDDVKNDEPVKEQRDGP